MAYFRGREATAIALAGAVPVMQRQGLWVYHKAGGSKQAIKDFAASKPDHIRRSMNEEGVSLFLLFHYLTMIIIN